jgi:hypothetical protein
VNQARAAIALGLALLATACTADDPSQPKALSDGSPARPPPAELQGIERPVLATRVRIASLSALRPGSATADCAAPNRVATGVAVERIDVRGRSVTYVAANDRDAYACDTVENSMREESWCGRAFGRLVGGRLRDPRLSLGCEDEAGEPVAFAWVQPAAGAVYVAIAHAGYSEAYRVAGGMPVRVSAHDVDVATSSARFDVSEHRRDGERLRAYELEAVVSG